MADRTATRNQGKLIDSLREELAAERIVLLAGAGLSLNASGTKPDSVASWFGLLENGIKRCRDINRKSIPKWVDYALRDKDSSEDYILLLALAEKITSVLKSKAGEYARWLEETVGTLRATNNKLFDALLHLEKARIMTTNYDHLLEDGLGGWRYVTWLDTEEVTRWITRVEKAVFHLHGSWRKSGSVVLGVRSYDSIVSSPQVQEQLRALWISKSFLFVGFGKGLGDPNFSALLAWARSIFPTSPVRHFRLVTDEEFTTISEQHVGDPINVISYGRHSDLAKFLASLRTYSNGSRASLESKASGNGSHVGAYGNTLSLEELVRILFGLDDAQLTQRFRSQFRSTVYDSVERPFYSAGSKQATRKLSVKNHSSVFYQGSLGLLKLQVFDLPAAATQIKASALAKNPDEESEVQSWVLLKNNDGKVKLISPTQRGGASYYRINGSGSRTLCVITFYKSYSTFYGGNEQIWLEVNNLCGKISQLKVLFGGKLSSIRFTNAYFLLPMDPVRFGLVPDLQTRRSDPEELYWPSTREEVLKAFEQFIESGFRQAAKSQSAQKTRVLWTEMRRGTQDVWTKIVFSDVNHDLMIAATGKYRSA